MNKQNSRLPNARVRVGIIGAGSIVADMHLPVLRRMPDLSVDWIVDINTNKARALASAYSVAGAFADVADAPNVDAVLVAIPVGAREAAWATILARKWHVLCEKPAARTTAEFDRLLGGVLRNERVVATGLMRRFYAGTLLMQRLFDERIFGDVVEIWAGEGGRQTRSGKEGDWYQLNAALAGGGVLIETGSHLLDQIISITGASDFSLTQYRQKPAVRSMEFDARITGVLSLSRQGAVPFSVVISRSDDIANGVFVRYSGGVLSLQPSPSGGVDIRDVRNRVIANFATEERAATNSFAAFYAEWSDFLRRCRQPDFRELRSDLARTRLSVAIIEQCYGRVEGGTQGSNTTGSDVSPLHAGAPL